MRTGATATSESNMSEGQVQKKAKRHVISSTFSFANNTIYWCDQALVSVGIVDGKDGHANRSGRRPVVAGLFFNLWRDSAILLEIL
jgi:hypothetical protein